MMVRFSRQRLAFSPGESPTSWPLLGSRCTWPDRNSRPLDLTACEYGPAAGGPGAAVTGSREWDIGRNVSEMPNRLASETSPYLLQHAGNPVDWYPWGDEAFARARTEDKPILLSVGYAACHWCHVMEHESFENDATAQLMNEHFVCVKVDREERPDVDSVYMDAVVAFNRGSGGWPMTVFLTPDREPFFGGTYYPPEPRHGLPSFGQVLQAMAEVYRDQRDAVAQQAEAIVGALRESARIAPSHEPLSEELFVDAVRVLRGQFDPRWGGFGSRRKFPPASTLEFLLRRGAAEDIVRTTLDGMAAGGVDDPAAGGVPPPS